MPKHLFVTAALALAVVVSIVYGFYVFVVSSNLYISEARFALRLSQQAATGELLAAVSKDSSGKDEASLARSAMSLIKGGSGGDDDFEQNPFVITNFLMSRAFVQELRQQGWLKERFSLPSVDYLSRLPADATLEEMWRFWMRHAMAAVDRRSNTIVLKVWGFTPEDAQATVELMIRRSEVLLNDLETRGRRDALDRAQQELNLANEEYAKKLQQISEMRQVLATVDPKEAATAAQNSLTRFEGERILMQRELQVLQTAENSNSPSAAMLRQRAKSLVSEVDGLRDRITGYEADVRAAVNALEAYEELDLNRRFALTRVQTSTLAVESASQLMREHTYFIYTFIAPSLPVEASQAWRYQQWLLVTFLAFVAWLGAITCATLNHDSRY
ncbi:hypothetical protein KHC28_12225 [Ancylobacter sonchi]|uniref:hypothetical protein n=1 Tax=Ancylobacter sonchi TaxID=1937790 RepID=UPI001BD2D981|nr:hypothetical protein [Ancylobacter sonchi]MBS7534424.1 hypothetical protein [Ancylobacter sonchi]